MKSSDDFEDAKAQAIEIVKLLTVLAMVGIALYVTGFYCSANKAPSTLFPSFFLLGFGIIHFFFTKSVSYLYNLQKKLIPFAPAATARFVRVVGAVSTVAGLGMLIFTVYIPA